MAAGPRAVPASKLVAADPGRPEFRPRAGAAAPHERSRAPMIPARPGNRNRFGGAVSPALEAFAF